MIRLFLLALCGFSLFSCSLTYHSEEPQVSHIPELVFSDARFVSYEDGKVSMILNASLLEQYQDDSALYGSQIHFTTYNKEGKLSSEGSSQMISADSSQKMYSLLGDVEIESLEEDVILKTDSIRWDGRTEQLITGGSDTISIRKGKNQGASEREADEAREGASSRIEMEGSGFSASGITMDFQFTGPVAGTIYTSPKEEE